MNRRTTLAALSASLLLISFAAPAGAQSIKTVAGTYAAVSVPAFGDKPRGMMILGADGRYSIVIGRATLAKIASGTRSKATADENKMVVDGTIAHYGKYTIDDGGKAITFHVEMSTFPNWDGAPQKRALKVSGDTLSYTVTAPSAGGPANDVVWKRVK
jgi:Lipocalin-like domain